MFTTGRALTVALAVVLLVQVPLLTVTVKLYPVLVLLLNVAFWSVLLNVPPLLFQL
jgi:hypothetical protein